ncbi:MAG: hypothetical protein ACLFPX_07040 [Candidatus Omnitrophota bacterium]
MGNFWVDLGLNDSWQLIVEIMLCMTFFIGIMLVVSAESVTILNRDFQKEIGFRKRFFPKLEDAKESPIDRAILQRPFWFGILIAVTSFLLLLLYRF